MEENGLLTRTVYAQVPPKVEYTLTELGKSLRPILDAMLNWGEQYKASLNWSRWEFFENSHRFLLWFLIERSAKIIVWCNAEHELFIRRIFNKHVVCAAFYNGGGADKGQLCFLLKLRNCKRAAVAHGMFDFAESYR